MHDTILERKISSLPTQIDLSVDKVWSSRRTVDLKIIKNRVIVTDLDTGEIILNVTVGDTFRIANEVRDWEVIKNEKGFIEFVKCGDDGRILRITRVRPGKWLMARTSGEVRNGMFHKIKDMPMYKIFEKSEDLCLKPESDSNIEMQSTGKTINGCELYWINPDSIEEYDILGREMVEDAKLYARWYPFIRLENGTFKPINIIESPREQDWSYSESSTILAREWCHNFLISDVKSEDGKFALAFWGSMLSLYINNNIK